MGSRGQGGVAPSFSLSTPLCPQLTREFFTKELTKHYQGSNDTDVFSATWNSVMITVSAPLPPGMTSSSRTHARHQQSIPALCP